MIERSTQRSRITGNFDIGSSVVMGGRSWASALHPCRTRPFTSIVHAPHTSSRQFASNTIGIVRLPRRLIGLRRISISIDTML
jgi:hypothetical protein